MSNNPDAAVSGTRKRGAVILLAAGTGTRFGSDKRQHLLAYGRPLLQTTLANYQKLFTDIVLVLRKGERALGQRLLDATATSTSLTIVIAEQAALGMGHSLAAGARNLQQQHLPLHYFFVALADMPYVRTDTLQLLQQHCEASSKPFIVQPEFQHRAGNPVAFSSNYLRELSELTGDTGARHLIQQHRRNLCRVTVDDPGIVQDIDTPADVQDREGHN